MNEVTLQMAKVGTTCRVSRCLSQKNDAYRLQEMGLYPGAILTVLQKNSILGALELALGGSRFCIAMELAEEFMVRDMGKKEG